MSLKESLLGFIDNVSLPAIFSRKAENLAELRKPLLKSAFSVDTIIGRCLMSIDRSNGIWGGAG